MTGVTVVAKSPYFRLKGLDDGPSDGGDDVTFVGVVQGEGDEDEFRAVGQFDTGGVEAGFTGPAGLGLKI